MQEAKNKGGRPFRYGEPTKAVRVPESRIEQIQYFVENGSLELPLYSSRVPAGFPSPADDHMDTKLDLNTYLIAHPAASFYFWVEGDSMEDAEIFDGQLAIADRSLEAKSGSIVVAVVNGEQTIKRLCIEGGRTYLKPENQKYKPIEITESTELQIIGVVLSTITVRRIK